MFWRLLSRVESRLRGRSLEQEMDAEMRFHLEMETEKDLAAGMTPAQARRLASSRLGGAEQVKEACRDVRSTWLDALWQDVRYAARSIRRDRAFTLASVATLALGIGATTSTYSVVDGTLFRALPYEQPDRLVMLMAGDPDSGRLSETLGLDAARALRRAPAFAVVSDYGLSSDPVKLLGRPTPETLRVVGVSTEFFATLGVQPFVGRAFSPEEGKPGRPAAVVVTYGAWQRHFGGDPSVVGRTISLSSDRLEELSGPVIVAGVLPASFSYPRWSVTAQPDLLAARPVEWNEPPVGDVRLVLLGRLRDGVTLREAQTQVDGIAASLQVPEGRREMRSRLAVRPLRAQMVAHYHDTLLTVMGAVLFLLLIACVNVATLTMARGRSRQRELAIRASLGAGRGRIARQLLTESALLAFVGAGIGVLVSYWTFDALLARLPHSMQVVRDMGIDGRVLGLAALLTVPCVAIVGGIPAVDAVRPDIMTPLKAGLGSRLALRAGRSRAWLLAVEVAFSLVLLVGAGLLAHSFVRLQRIDLGFDPKNLLATDVSAPRARFPDGARVRGFMTDACERIRAVPGVKSVATADVAPLSGALFGERVALQGETKTRIVDVYRVSPDYFETVGVRTVAGRLLTAADEGAGQVAVVNETMAHLGWGVARAVGRTVLMSQDVRVRVVGVVSDVRSQARMPAAPTLYVAYEPSYRRYGARAIIVRTHPGRGDIRGAITSVVRGLDTELEPTTDSVADWLARTTSPPRLYLLVYGVFATLGLLLASVGIAGVASHNVIRRTREIAVRLALGATPVRVVGMVARQALWPVMGGVAAGLVGAAVLTRGLTQLLFDITPYDPLTYAAVVLLLAAVAILATWLPSRRAARIRSIDVLRAE